AVDFAIADFELTIVSVRGGVAGRRSVGPIAGAARCSVAVEFCAGIPTGDVALQPAFVASPTVAADLEYVLAHDHAVSESRSVAAAVQNSDDPGRPGVFVVPARQLVFAAVAVPTGGVVHLFAGLVAGCQPAVVVLQL